jgi:hypothetical protein
MTVDDALSRIARLAAESAARGDKAWTWRHAADVAELMGWRLVLRMTAEQATQPHCSVIVQTRADDGLTAAWLCASEPCPDWEPKLCKCEEDWELE